MNIDIERKQILMLCIIATLIVFSGVLSLSYIADSPRTSLIIEREHFACTQDGTVDMSVSTWERLAVEQ